MFFFLFRITINYMYILVFFCLGKQLRPLGDMMYLWIECARLLELPIRMEIYISQ